MESQMLVKIDSYFLFKYYTMCHQQLEPRVAINPSYLILPVNYGAVGWSGLVCVFPTAEFTVQG